jgi:hypothetical protein
MTHICNVNNCKHEHKYSSSDYKCDERRMSELYDETPGKTVIFIRYNPHKYKVPKNEDPVSIDNRQELLLSTLQNILKTHDDTEDNIPLQAYYICYSKNNSLIAHNIAKKLIYKQDILDK